MDLLPLNDLPALPARGAGLSHSCSCWELFSLDPHSKAAVFWSEVTGFLEGLGQETWQQSAPRPGVACAGLGQSFPLQQK